MRPPVRKVCGGCLRSVELPSSSDNVLAPSSNECPHCGGVIDSKSDPFTPLGIDDDKTEPGHGPFPFSSGSGETVDWAETWNRGTLGVIGRYQLRERLGEGGFGQVFQAFDPRLDRDVALKVLKQPNPTERVMQRFFREARAAARLDHPNIVAVHDAGFENGRCWIAYQYIRGRPLWWYRNHHKLDFPTAAKIIRDLADALDHAHRLGVLHRDLKPANVIMDDQNRPRLTDFGLARRSDLDSSLTRDGAMVGTPAYMSPEQARGDSRNVDERSDLYSLGVMFHELLYGCRPRDSGDEPDSSSVSLSAAEGTGRFGVWKPKPRAAVPASLRRICDRALASAVDQRYPNARSLADDLDCWLRGNRTRADSLRRHIVPAMLGSALTLFGCVGLAAAWFPLRSRLALPTESSMAIPPNAIVSATPKPTSPAPSGTTPFVGNPAKKIYHKSDSSCVRHMLVQNRVPIESAAKAKADGYRACDNCFHD